MAENSIFKVLIVDDEPDSVALLRSLLEEVRNVEIVGEANHFEQAIYLIIDHLPNLVFLDINMPGKSGVDLKNLMNKRMMDVQIVFVSAHKEYAIEAIRCGVYDFLLKPVDRDELKAVVEKYRKLNHQLFQGKVADMVSSFPEEIKIRINSRHSYILVNPSEIVYCQTYGGYTYIYLSNGKMETSSSTLSQLEPMVDRWNFFRLGRSFLINLDYVSQIDKSTNKCILKSNSNTWEVKSSQTAIKELLTSNFNYA